MAVAKGVSQYLSYPERNDALKLINPFTSCRWFCFNDS